LIALIKDGNGKIIFKVDVIVSKVTKNEFSIDDVVNDSINKPVAIDRRDIMSTSFWTKKVRS
jgi:hypothetical protein